MRPRLFALLAVVASVDAFAQSGPTRGDVIRTMNGVAIEVVACARWRGDGTVEMRVTWDATGRFSSVTVLRQPPSTRVEQACIDHAFQSTTLPLTSGTPFTIVYPFTVRR